MTLHLVATTCVPDLVIDFIEVRLQSGETVSLNWDTSRTEHHNGKLNALYNGVCFNEEPAKGMLVRLAGMHIEDIGLYAESQGGEGDYPLSIDKMEFYDENDTLSFEDVFTTDCPERLVFSPVMRQLYDKFLASSRR